MTPFVSRRPLARVLTSLLRDEIKAAGLGAGADLKALMDADQWSEDLQMAGSGPVRNGGPVLPCDSLDLLRLGARVNEMFHLHEAGQELDLLSASYFGDWLDSIEAGWASGVERITFLTSGSAGIPKRCTHQLPNLQTEIAYLGELFAGRTRIVPLAPAHHIYGFLFTAMLPDRLGHHCEQPPESMNLRIPQDLQSGDLVVTFPERWQWLDRMVAKWPDGVAGVVSTAPCPAALKSSLMERGLASFTEVYGSSETAGVGIRRWPETLYRLMPHWKVADVEDAEATSLQHSSGFRVRVQDRLQLHEGGSFALAGRIDAAVQVGGTNVYPARIASLLRARPGVCDAAVRLRSPEDGGRLKAFVVPNPDVDREELRKQLELWVNSALDTVERPKSITFGNALPGGDTGKASDW